MKEAWRGVADRHYQPNVAQYGERERIFEVLEDLYPTGKEEFKIEV
jgi:hypothetical protein